MTVLKETKKKQKQTTLNLNGGFKYWGVSIGFLNKNWPVLVSWKMSPGSSFPYNAAHSCVMCNVCKAVDKHRLKRLVLYSRWTISSF